MKRKNILSQLDANGPAIVGADNYSANYNIYIYIYIPVLKY